MLKLYFYRKVPNLLVYKMSTVQRFKNVEIREIIIKKVFIYFGKVV